jgi:hypothetical protein
MPASPEISTAKRSSRFQALALALGDHHGSDVRGRPG